MSPQSSDRSETSKQALCQRPSPAPKYSGALCPKSISFDALWMLAQTCGQNRATFSVQTFSVHYALNSHAIIRQEQRAMFKRQVHIKCSWKYNHDTNRTWRAEAQVVITRHPLARPCFNLTPSLPRCPALAYSNKGEKFLSRVGDARRPWPCDIVITPALCIAASMHPAWNARCKGEYISYRFTTVERKKKALSLVGVRPLHDTEARFTTLPLSM